MNIRDPLYGFIDLDDCEAQFLSAPPVQRLRHIHQLGLTLLVYPSASHKRFEHSLGVAHLAGKIFDVVTQQQHIYPELQERIPYKELDLKNWRRIVRLGALLHDIGHLPFSHAAEDELLPYGWDHERLGVEYITSDHLKSLFDKFDISPKDVARIAVGKKKLPNAEFSPWEELVSEIIVGDVFGADRMDYLLRDSYHLGVAYGHFDHHRLIQRLRILPDVDDSTKPTLGIDEGGMHVAEGLLLARYFMFSQVYLEETRRICDYHLKEFLLDYLNDGPDLTNLETHLGTTDNEIFTALKKAASDRCRKGHVPATRLMKREHFRFLGKRDPDEDISGEDFVSALRQEFGEESVILDKTPEKSKNIDFPVWRHQGTKHEDYVSVKKMSKVISMIPAEYFEGIFCDPAKYEPISSRYHPILESLRMPLLRS